MDLKRWVIKDEDGLILNTFAGEAEESWIGWDWQGSVVHSVEQIEDLFDTRHKDTWAMDRRGERALEFSQTIDKFNPFRYGLLTAEELTEIEAWRQAWLDYPSDEALERPVRPDTLN